ncbi:SMI1/KNR4 family protein [Streptomyces sp. NPDC051665]|uniref:SMI1/KNR4 family protein n=1 Tax=Streptomyces sp. NPDC051665 TaxID=3154647 RepID=UPI003426756A
MTDPTCDPPAKTSDDGCSPAVIARAEREMGLTFPPSYRLLIEEFGTWEVAPTEFLGVCQTERAGDVLLSSVAETLDTSRPDENGEYPVFAWNPGVLDGGLMERLADSYGEFALAECRQKLT